MHLTEGFRRFRRSASERGAAQLMTVLGEMGASQQAMGEIFAFHKHTLQQSPEQANRTLLEMRAFSRATGRHIDEIMTEYAKKYTNIGNVRTIIARTFLKDCQGKHRY